MQILSPRDSSVGTRVWTDPDNLLQPPQFLPDLTCELINEAEKY